MNCFSKAVVNRCTIPSSQECSRNLLHHLKGAEKKTGKGAEGGLTLSTCRAQPGPEDSHSDTRATFAGSGLLNLAARSLASCLPSI